MRIKQTENTAYAYAKATLGSAVAKAILLRSKPNWLFSRNRLHCVHFRLCCCKSYTTEPQTNKQTEKIELRRKQTTEREKNKVWPIDKNTMVPIYKCEFFIYIFNN